MPTEWIRVVPYPIPGIVSSFDSLKKITDQFVMERHFCFPVSLIWCVNDWFSFKIIITILWKSMHASLFTNKALLTLGKGFDLRKKAMPDVVRARKLCTFWFHSYQCAPDIVSFSIPFKSPSSPIYLCEKPQALQWPRGRPTCASPVAVCLSMPATHALTCSRLLCPQVSFSLKEKHFKTETVRKENMFITLSER